MYNSIKKIFLKIGIHLTKEVKDLCPEIYKILMKEFEEDTKKKKKGRYPIFMD